MISLIQDVSNHVGFSICPLVLFAILDIEMRAHVISTESQVDFESFVSENLLFVPKNGVCEARLEGTEGIQSRLGRCDKTDVEDIVGARQPCNKLALAQGRNSSKYIQSSCESSAIFDDTQFDEEIPKERMRQCER